jgi:hypothetical protein
VFEWFVVVAECWEFSVTVVGCTKIVIACCDVSGSQSVAVALK